MSLLARFAVNMLVVFLGIRYLPGIHGAENLMNILITSVVITLLNAVLKPIIVVLTIPITFLTLGFFLLVINAAIIMLAGNLLDGFVVDGFWYALLFSVVLSLVNSFFENDTKKRKAHSGR